VVLNGDLDGLVASAERFITMFHAESRAGAPDRRLGQVRREIAATGSYWHTPAELTFGARAAWRNSSGCIGRRYWQSLRVRDRREVTTAPDIAAESAAHLREATNDGQILPLITVFAPDAPGRPGPRILNSQLVRYAGYERPGGAITGDPANVVITRLARALGWSAGSPPGRFDILPLLVQQAGALPAAYELPADAVLEVMIKHPEFGWFANLGLRWYAVPAISDMSLEIGGVRYPAAPFNGWYMCTEIGSRYLGDAVRYDQVPVIAEHMGLNTACQRTMWQDKAITELNLAVLHSFTAAGVTISDHRTEQTPAPVRHRDESDKNGADESPNFYRHDAPARVTELFDGNALASAGPGPGPGLTPERPYGSSLAYAAALGIPESRFLE
jgi:nitric-oxide synthase, bacterial